MLLAICLIGMACKEKKADCAICTEKEIIEVIKNELVTIYFSGFPIQSEGVDSLGFAREQNEQNIQKNRMFLHPCYGQVPLEYRVKGLKVRISGNITNCHPDIYAPYERLLPSYIFELTSIKKVE
jgi:hypothetical protein